MSKKCPRCESKDIHITEYPAPTDNMATCYGCGYADLADRFPEQTVFNQITASPEVLAKELVTLDCDSLWFAWVGIGRREAFSTREEAIAATVEKLKEVEM